ncbi:MAG: indolepyruvate oxidoreductase subunit beta [Lachnospiraceae bacterium]|nr:indolepyruvate oxidoreductase subunit beta [Lachnospiraceae bacterium]
MSYNILLCGVGGQGTVLASKLLAAAAQASGETVHSAETIGMAQRGGPVTSHVRIGADVYSPLIPKGAADLIIAFEPGEAVRNLPYLKPEGALIVNSVAVMPVTEALRPSGYEPQKMIEFLRSTGKPLAVVDANALCAPLGSVKFFNVAVLGFAVGAGWVKFDRETMLSTIEASVKPAFVETNKKAFLEGAKEGEIYAKELSRA